MLTKKYLIVSAFVLIIFVLTLKTMYSSSEKFIKNLVENNTQIKFIDIHKISENNGNNIIVKNNRLYSRIARSGEIGLAESYMDGDWYSDDLESTISELFLKSEILEYEIKKQSINFIFMELKEQIKNFIENNSIKSSIKNVSHHYDIGNDLYKKMLGKHMQYTCAYFNKPNMSLDEAQYAKMELIAKKLDLKPNMKILDIGCGYGSLASHLAVNYNVYVIGVTLSKEQKAYADEHYSHPNVKIELKDYRHLNGKFDRVYSIGMFEHVGRKNYHEYYNKCYELLKSDGIMLIHTIGTNYRKWHPHSFINKYIFPEGQLPHIENLTGNFIDKWHLEDWQNFGLSYAKTLRCWYNNIGDWSDLENYDEKFRRMWKLYLLGCAANFQNRGICLWQIVYTKQNSNRSDDCHHIRI